jgi:hypothetical protein
MFKIHLIAYIFQNQFTRSYLINTFNRLIS